MGAEIDLKNLAAEERAFHKMIKAKSYHVFSYPFQWDAGKSVPEISKIIEKGAFNTAPFKKGLRWKRIPVLGKEDGFIKKSYGSTYSDRLLYKVYQYYNYSSRNLVLGRDDFALKYALCDENGDYAQGQMCIEYADRDKMDGSPVKKSVKLDLIGIKLDIFEFGIGIISFEVVNSENGETKRTPEEILSTVNIINEKGRRLYPPYIPAPHNTAEYTDDETPDPLTAEKIIMKIRRNDDECEFVQDYKNITEQITVSKQNGKIEIGELLPSYITELIPFMDHIKTITDDRMFCCTLVMDDGIAARVEQYSEGNCGTFTEELYKFTYVETSLSCQSASMKKKILEESIYDRWVEYGTIYGVSHHSFVSVMRDVSTGGPDKPYFLVENFAGLYVPMVKIVLAQRAGLLIFSERVAELSREVKDYKKHCEKRLEASNSYQQDYSRFLNEFMLQEISSEEQAVELYGLIQKQLYIERIQKSLTEQSGILNEITETLVAHQEENSDKKLQNILAVLSVVGFWYEFAQIIDIYKDKEGLAAILTGYPITLISSVIGLIGFAAIIWWIIRDKIK